MRSLRRSKRFNTLSNCTLFSIDSTRFCLTLFIDTNPLSALLITLLPEDTAAFFTFLRPSVGKTPMSLMSSSRISNSSICSKKLVYWSNSGGTLGLVVVVLFLCCPSVLRLVSLLDPDSSSSESTPSLSSWSEFDSLSPIRAKIMFGVVPL